MPQSEQNRSPPPKAPVPLAGGRSQPAHSAPANSGAPRAWIVAVVLAVSIGAVYGRALDVPFIFDDIIAIRGNESIFSLWPLTGTTAHPGPLNPAQDLPTTARPLVNVSLAINYYFGGVDPTGYHAVNMAIHFFSALLVWAIMRRTLRLSYFAGRFKSSAGWLAFAVALLWALHPLQTEAVIYATQRTELMMALFYLATLYCSLRYWAAMSLASTLGQENGLPANRTLRRRRTAWLLLAVLSCLCGMASKEVMASAPLMVLLFERTFISGSLAKALRRSWPLYVGLALTWVLLLGLSLGAPHKGSAGFGIGVAGYTWWLTQMKIMLMYLKLAFWPWPLLIHYEMPYLTSFTEAWMYVVPVLLLGISTLVLLWRNDPIGYLGTWIFAILSPTSLVPIVTEMAAERRMYLPLVALVVLLVVVGYRLAAKLLSYSDRGRQTFLSLNMPLAIVTGPVLLLAIVFALVSAKRLTAYDSELNLWREVLVFQPENARAHGSVGALLLAKPDQQPNAIEELQIALQLKPDYLEALNNLGVAFTHAGRLPEAFDAFHKALALKPDYLDALNNLGMAFMRSGNFPEAVEQLQTAVRVRPNYVDTHNTLGIALYRSGKNSEAIEQFRLALELNPNQVHAHSNLGLLLASMGDVEGAIPHLEAAVRLLPDSADFHNKLADVLRQSGRHGEAIEHYQAAVRLQPDLFQAYENLAKSFSAVDRSQEAVATAQHAIEVARSAQQEAAAAQIEDWLTHYQLELRRGRDADSPTQPPPPTR